MPTIPHDVRQHIGADTLVFLNKNDLAATETGDLVERLRLVTPYVWTGSVLHNSSGGMDGFVTGLVETLRQRYAILRPFHPRKSLFSINYAPPYVGCPPTTL